MRCKPVVLLVKCPVNDEEHGLNDCDESSALKGEKNEHADDSFGTEDLGCE